MFQICRHCLVFFLILLPAGTELVYATTSFVTQGPFTQSALSSVFEANDDDLDPDQPEVSLTGNATVHEGATGAASVEVQRNGTLLDPLTVNYAVSGSASTADYFPLSGNVVIPAGQASAIISVQWRDDTLQESDETIVLTLSANNAYRVRNPDRVTITILDNDSSVSVSVANSSINEGAGATFVLRRSQAISRPLSVRFSITGSAESGSDYSMTGSSPVTIPANAATVNVPLSVLADGTFEADETIVLTVLASSPPDYIVGSPSSATLTIAGLPSVTVAASDSAANESGDTASFTFTRSGGAASSLVVMYTVGGTATRDADFSMTPAAGSVTIPAGSASASVLVRPIDDALIEGDETVIVTVGNNANHVAGAANTATATITDNDQRVEIPALFITGPPPPPVPTSNAAVAVELSAPSPVRLDGTLSLAFNAATAVPSGYRDPALQFVAGGSSLNFGIAPQARTTSLAQNGAIQQGTVAGEIVVSVSRLMAENTSVLPQPAPTRTITVPRLPPVITPDSVRIINVTANTFEVDVTAYSTPRDMATANFTFASASGTGIEGPSTFTLDIRNAVTQWYASQQSLAFGSLLRLRFRFTLEGDSRSLQNVTVRLTNSVGSSAPVTGGR